MNAPLQLVRDLDSFSARDLEQIMNWNETAPGKVQACAHHFIERNARDSPGSPAVCSWDGNLTFGELDRLSFQLAHHLIGLGVGPEVLVPVCFEKSMWTIVAMLAILKAGGAFVPLDPSHPRERLKGIVGRVKADLVVTSPMYAGLFEGIVKYVAIVSPAMLESLTRLDSPLDVNVQPGNAAFVLFTSGSTGQPKGILQEHGFVCSSSLAHIKALRVSSQSRVLQFAAYTFDVSMMDIFTTLIWGGCVCVPSETDGMNNITNVMNDMHVNRVLFTPSFASLIRPEDVPELRKLVLGGEAVTQDNITRWASRVELSIVTALPNAQLV